MSPPKTIEEMLQALADLSERYPRFQGVPYEDSTLMSHEFVRDICSRIIELEQKSA